MAQTLVTPQVVTSTEFILPETESDTEVAVRYKYSVDGDTQISRHKAVKQQEGSKLKHH